jgi:P4 family phage/plasmid primase-like protien
MENKTEFQIEQFTKFYDCLMKNAPEGYTPWFFPCAKNGKNPSPLAILKINPENKGSWHHESARLSKEQVIEHIKQGYNIGISARENDPLIVGDIDESEYLSQAPEGTLKCISRKRCGCHFFGWDKDGSAKLNIPTDFGELRSSNQYVLAPGSYVAFDLSNEKDKKAFDNLTEEAKKDELLGYYTIRDEISPGILSFKDLPRFFKDQQEKNLEAVANVEITNLHKEFKGEGKYSDLFKLKVSDIVGALPSNKRVGHPLHESDTDSNFSLSKDGTIGHCWRHLVSLNAVQFLCVKAGYMSCQDAGTPHKGAGVSKIKGDKKALEVAYNEAVKMGLIEEKNLRSSAKILTREGQIEEFYQRNPFFFDRSKMFFVWNRELCKYELSDTTDLLNEVAELLGLDTISSKIRGELIAGFEQIGRRHIPTTAPLSWVQYKNKICDFKTGELFEATPEYFITNPLPYDLGKSEETPTIDKLFSEWVGEDYKETLYQVVAYCVSSDQFMQRLIALVGGGSNGKGTFIKLLKRFIGKDNLCTSELKELSGGGFETSAIYKKLVCFMGEVSYDDLKNTNQIKKLAGEDDIRFCFKGKTPFTDVSITTLISATNSLPKTPDKTIGFYRKWLIIDFPNQFEGITKDIIADIPEVEFNNLAKKTFRILKEMYQKQRFHNEGNFEERVNRYEERSNPLQKFVETQCEEVIGEKVELRVFSNAFNEYAKKNHLRVMTVRQISKILKDDGFEIGQRKIEGTTSSKQVILNLSFILSKKTNETNETNVTPKSSPVLKSFGHLVGSVGSVGFSKKEPQSDIEELDQLIAEAEANQ